LNQWNSAGFGSKPPSTILVLICIGGTKLRAEKESVDFCTANCSPLINLARPVVSQDRVNLHLSVPSFNSREVCGSREELVSSLAFVIQAILDLPSTKAGDHAPRTQFYVFSSSEQVASQGHLIDTALAEFIANKDTQAAICLCVAALSKGANTVSFRRRSRHS
jgi:hypothetical protein